MKSEYSYVEIRSDGAETLPLDQLESIADQVVSLVDLLAGGPDVAVWPTGDEQGFAWRHGFGRRTRAEAMTQLRSQLLRRTYIDDMPVFPRMTFGDWELEVLHPSPPRSSSAWGVFWLGPAAPADAEATLSEALGTAPAPSGEEREIAAGAVSATISASRPGLAGRLLLDGPNRAAKIWRARIGEEVGDVGTRLWCDPAVMTASGAASIAELYARVAAATWTARGPGPRRSRPVGGPEAHLRGGSVRADLAVPEGRSWSRRDLLDLVSSADGRHGGCLTIQASPGRQRGRRFGWDDTGNASTLDEWQADIAGVPTLLRHCQRSSDSTGPWQWLQITPAPTAAARRT